MILDLQTLRPERGNGNDAGAEDRSALRLVSTAFTHLKKTGIDHLLFELVVDLFGALAFEDDRGNPHRPVPGGKIGNRGMARQSENIVPFLNAAGVIGKNLAHEDPRIAIVDADRDFHFLEREDCGIRLLLVARNKDACVGKQQRRREKRNKNRPNKVFHECSFCSGMRTSPLSVPT